MGQGLLARDRAAGGTLLPQLRVAAVIQLPSACLEGGPPSRGLGDGGGGGVREGRGRGIKGPVGQFFWMLRSHRITVARD